MNGRRFIFLGAILGFLSVAFGAFGAHVLQTQLDAKLMTAFQKAVYYQGFHSLALLITGLLLLQVSHRLLNIAGWSFFAGIILFSGSLYLMAMTGYKSLGIITPAGGTAFLVGWFTLALAARKLPRSVCQ